MIILLFDDGRELLGEIVCEDGAFLCASLAGSGEQLIGPFVRDWQARGISVPGVKPVRTHDRRFADALHLWANHHRVATVPLSNEYIPYWNRLLRLPFNAAELFTLLVALSETPVGNLPAWDSFLEEGIAATNRAEEKTRADLKKLYDKAAREFMRNSA
ncbi:hypothetical protein KJZ71_02430 [Patescibacteria group bacterium]|uniref:Uncharacterized protein n=1 Tax=candidate division WWE3 bacterium TaxID=2053526 RepID=A0A928Y6G0_UNCKA|nr:hypothetical protein [candidate division WWE3 bacterium]MCL4732643.1 hypothetical protein [Patescibacteria group bacterium]MDL1952703.1 hypothetical protein [Candidatus Uhrbacteria bacterium UHB]RIL01167.1 MAG: hypothetical protein DCC77_01345 [Candidatus Uhrbacteria bacterium]